MLNSKFEYNHGIIPTLATQFTSQPSGKNKDSQRADRIVEELRFLEDKRCTMKRMINSEENPKRSKRRRTLTNSEKPRTHKSSSKRKFNDSDQEDSPILEGPTIKESRRLDPDPDPDGKSQYQNQNDCKFDPSDRIPTTPSKLNIKSSAGDVTHVMNIAENQTNSEVRKVNSPCILTNKRCNQPARSDIRTFISKNLPHNPVPAPKLSPHPSKCNNLKINPRPNSKSCKSNQSKISKYFMKSETTSNPTDGGPPPAPGDWTFFDQSATKQDITIKFDKAEDKF